jgi:hypothetical protein
MAAKLTRLTHKIAIQLYLMAECCTIYSSRSRRPVRKLLDAHSYVLCFSCHLQVFTFCCFIIMLNVCTKVTQIEDTFKLRFVLILQIFSFHRRCNILKSEMETLTTRYRTLGSRISLSICNVGRSFINSCGFL